MPAVRNHTPFSNLRYYSADSQRREFGVLIVKGTFAFDGARLAIAEEQAPLVFTDLCHGDVNVSALWHPSDLVPFKPGGDIVVNAVARAPGGVPAPTWLSALRVEGRDQAVERAVRVTGARAWRPQWDRALEAEEVAEWRRHRSLFQGWTLDEPAPATVVPLRYELAYGGLMPRGEGVVDANEYNPLGVGWIDREHTDHTALVTAPQLEDPSHPVTDPYEALAPYGMGPIPPAWLPRRPLGGTYDQRWIDEVWPHWPADYDFAYHQSAPPGLRWSGFFSGDERVTLVNMIPGVERFELALPAMALDATFARPDDTRARVRMNLDTVFFDIAGESADDRRVFLTWRARFEPDVFERVELDIAPLVSTDHGDDPR